MERSVADAIKTMRLCMAMIGMLGLIGAGAAYAQMKGNFDDADANHDGRITLQEFEAFASNRLMAGNGPRAQRFKELAPQDQDARLQARFQKLDRGGKGYLDRSDWSRS